MPANIESPYKEDNYYHLTKIMCEKNINRAILKGLNAVILRPSITYGLEDTGFPYQLVKLVKNNTFLVSNKNVWMHLCHIDTISTAFVKLVTDKFSITGRTFNIADIEPVRQRDLVNFIYRQLNNKNYPRLLTIDNNILRFGERVSRFVKNELWTSRFELISHSWFYQVQASYDALELPQHYTIPDFKIITNEFKKKIK
jgi:nucleoside-diphosphate-sugar epimerase